MAMDVLRLKGPLLYNQMWLFYPQHDRMTQVNMDFVTMCVTGACSTLMSPYKPGNCRSQGVRSWETIYQGLSSLPEKIQKAGLTLTLSFRLAFPDALPLYSRETIKNS
jgi:hypothetical protein